MLTGPKPAKRDPILYISGNCAASCQTIFRASSSVTEQLMKLSIAADLQSTKAAVGDHDENISFAQCEAIIGAELGFWVRDTAIALLYFHTAIDIFQMFIK